MVPAEKVVRGITLNFCLLKYCRCNENQAIIGGCRCHGQSHGVGTWVAGCALASLLGVEYKQHYIQNALIIRKKNPSSIRSCATKIPLHIAQIPLQKMGYLRCDTVGVFTLLVSIHKARTCKKKPPPNFLL
jgi:hypothetical protein